MRRKIIVFLLFGLIFNLSRAQSESELSEQFELASAQLSKTQDISPVISMDFQDADLKDVLKVFSQQAGLNFIASERIKDRRVTLYLDEVTVEDALNTIMSANNLTYEQEEDSNIFVVREWGKPEVETITKIFPLQYARVKGYELTTAGEEKKESKKIGIEDIIEKILSQTKDDKGQEYSKVIGDIRTNSLIITDVPRQFPKIEKAIKELDIKLPQVMIEVEIIETALDTIDKLGIEWGTAAEGELFQGAGAARSHTWPYRSTSALVGPTGVVDNLYLGYISATNLEGTLAMLAQDTNTKILARPRILTLNNETAEIKITADTAIASLEQITSSEEIAASTVSAERVETGVTLKVTPQINKENEITMFIEPSVTNTKWSQYFSGTYVDPQTRSAKTTVTVRDGETVIIAGLINVEDTKISKKVPFFGDIPLLGYLFRKKDEQVTDKELIIFITPYLVKERVKTAGFPLEKQTPWEYENSGLKEEAMEKILDRLER
ncbi:MAG: secretin N-terminal domain-containing protein [bacterium]